MGRTPCCDKTKVKKGPWSPTEDMKLISYIQKHGHQNWRVLPAQAGLSRCGKSCRLRWVNYLRPGVKRGNITAEEEETIMKLHRLHGNKWSMIASHLPGRTDNEIKNVWHTHLKKRLDDEKPNNNIGRSSNREQHNELINTVQRSPSYQGSSHQSSTCSVINQAGEEMVVNDQVGPDQVAPDDQCDYNNNNSKVYNRKTIIDNAGVSVEDMTQGLMQRIHATVSAWLSEPIPLSNVDDIQDYSVPNPASSSCFVSSWEVYEGYNPIDQVPLDDSSRDVWSMHEPNYLCGTVDHEYKDFSNYGGHDNNVSTIGGQQVGNNQRKSGDLKENKGGYNQGF